MSELKPTPVYNSATGLMEIIEPRTGKVLKVQRTKDNLLQDADFIEIDIDGQKILVERNVPLSSIRGSRAAYSEVLGVFICQQLVDRNVSLKKLCEDPEVPPYSTICRWRREEPAFRQMLEDARRDRAELSHDEALEIADQAKDASTSEEIQAAKLRVETRKWSAERSDPERFGPRAKEQAAIGGVTFIINTGITRVGDPGYREVTPHGTHIEQIESVPARGSASGDGVESGDTTGAGPIETLGLPSFDPGAAGSPGQF